MKISSKNQTTKTPKALVAHGNSTRTIISLPNPQKRWLEDVAKREGVAMTAVVRDAVAHYQQHLAAPLDDFSALGSRLQGSWKRGDGLAWQTQMRDEW